MPTKYIPCTSSVSQKYIKRNTGNRIFPWHHMDTSFHKPISSWWIIIMCGMRLTAETNSIYIRVYPISYGCANRKRLVFYQNAEFKGFGQVSIRAELWT